MVYPRRHAPFLGCRRSVGDHRPEQLPELILRDLALAPIPTHLFVERLVERVRREGTREVILATDPDAEGEATARLVLEALHSAGLAPRVTRMARGLPAGSAIEYLHKGVLEDALEGRVELLLSRNDQRRG